ncbi:hypothetical protein [uncultured Aquimarina sp.]|uniref:hypothetical protein n=1 Tax=uncultured Aquimarina sp. TaxID=575652 RepID=UPI002609E228|nr:hypothetical protein [uncultured Aquimarina sp.]
MKNIITLLALIVVTITFAQAPEGFNYQAVARDAMGDIIVNTTIGVEFQLHETTIDGPVIYTETHSPTTNAYGIFNLIVGQGTSTDTFNLVDWATDLHFIETSIDLANGSTYVTIGTTQLLSVPYALHAKTATNGITTAQATILGNTSGTNTGDQDITGITSNAVLIAALEVRITALENPPPAVGGFREGGIVFWIDPMDNTKGLVVDLNDLALAQAEWGCNGIDITGADGSAIGTGAQNTMDILAAGCGGGAALCNASTNGGFNDWFLPSTDAMTEISNNITTINAAITLNGGTVINTSTGFEGSYWTSTEVNSDKALSFFFVSGSSSTFFNKFVGLSVRGVRAF